MGLIVITPPVSTALTTLAILREEIPAAVTASDSRLTRLLSVASSAIADYIGPVALGTYMERYVLQIRNGIVDAHPLILSVRPAVALVSVGTVLAADIGNSLELDSANGILRIVQPLSVADSFGFGVGWGIQDIFGWVVYSGGLPFVEVTYQGGYTLPGATDNADDAAPTYNLNPQIEQAAIDSVRYLLATPRDPSVKSETIVGVGGVVYNDPTGILPPHVIQTLNSLRGFQI